MMLLDRVPVKLSPTIAVDGSDAEKHTVNKHAIIGGVVVGVIAFFAAAIGLFFFIRRRGYVSKAASKVPALNNMTVEPLDIHSLPGNDRSEWHLNPSPHITSYSQETRITNTQTGSTPAVTLPVSRTSGLRERQVYYSLRPGEGKGASNGSAGYAGENQIGRSSSSEPSTMPEVNDQDLRRDLEDLRMEVVRMRQERDAADEAPPLYDFDVEGVLRH